MNSKKNGGNIGTVIVLVIAIIFGFASCSSGSKYDVAHDPNGFLGYSDSFWEWYSEHN